MTLLAAISIFALILPFPFCSDLSIYQWMAHRFVHDGALPYVGSWDDNFPGIIAFHSLSILLFGNSELGFRIIEAVFHIVTALVLYRLLLHWLHPRTAFLATLFYGLGATSWGIYYLGQRDVFAAGLLIWALAAWDAHRTQRRWLILSALLFGCCVLIRPTYLIPGLTLVFLLRRSLSASWGLIFVAGLFFPLLLSTVPYLMTGTFDQYYDSTVLYNLSVYQTIQSPTRDMFARLADAAKLFGFAALAFLPSRFLSRVSDSDTPHPFLERERWTYALILIELLLLFVVQRKYLSYQLAPFLALLSPLAAVGLERIVLVIPGRILRTWAMVLIILAWFFAYSPLLPVIRAITTKDMSSLMPFANDPEIGLKVDDDVSSYLRRSDNLKGAIEVVAFDARLRSKLDRKETSRFTMAQALALTNADGTQPDFQRQWRKEFISNVANTPARFVIIGKAWGFWRLPPLGPNLKSELPELDSLLTTNYNQDTTIGTYAIYRIKSDRGPTTIAVR